jgi:hypothetical protein
MDALPPGPPVAVPPAPPAEYGPSTESAEMVRPVA